MKKDSFNYLNAEKTVLLPDAWVRKNGVFDADLENVAHNYFFGFVFGEDFSASASAYKHHTNKSSKMNQLWLFWLMTLACEDGSCGALSIGFNKNSKPALYAAVVAAIARHKCNVQTQADMRLLKRHVVASTRYNPELQLDIIEAIDTLRAKDAEKTQNKTGPKKGANQTPTETSVCRPPIIAIGLSYTRKKYISDNVPFYPGITGKSLNPYSDVAESQIDVVDEDGNLFDRETIDRVIKTTEENYIQKVELIVTPVPDTYDQDKYVGFLAHFAVKDKTWNPGKLLNKLKNRKLVPKLFPQYLTCPSPDFPTTNFSFNRYVKVASEQLDLSFTAESIDEQLGRVDLEDYGNRLHLHNVLSLEKALERLRDAGGCAFTLNTLKDNVDEKNNLVVCYEESYRVPIDRIFWYSPIKAGLYEYHFPWVEIKNHMVIDDEDTEVLPLNVLAENQCIVSREDIYNAMPSLLTDNRTNNELVELRWNYLKVLKKLEGRRPPNMLETFNKFQDDVKKYGENWRDYLDDYDRQEVAAYEKYTNTYKRVSQNFMNRYADICSLDGENNASSIPHQMKAILRWYKEYIDNHCSGTEDQPKTLTRDLQLADPRVSFFGNSMIKLCNTYGYVYNLTQPKYTLLLEGLFSIYEADTKIRFHMIVFGAAATGKTHHIDNMIKKNFIPGTFSSEDYATKAVDNTDTDVLMEIRVKGEIDPIYSDKKAAEKDPVRVNREKTKLTEQELTSRVFEFIEDPLTGNKIRASRRCKAKHEYVFIGTGNDVKQEESALTSRFITTTMKRSKKPVNEFNDDKTNENPQKKTDAKTYIQRMQFLSCIVKQAMGVGAIWHSVEMQLWNDISSRVIDNLIGWTGRKSSTARSLDIMSSLVRQFVVRMAWHYTYDIKGAPFYNKPFDISQLKELQRYLYVTPDIILFVITILSEQYVNEDAGNVMRAIFKYLQIKEEDYEKSPYYMYTHDKTDRIKFAQTINGNRKTDRNQYNVNLNYFYFDVSLDELSKALSPLTEPTLTPQYVAAVLKHMEHETFEPKVGENNRNGYGLVGCDDLEMHKFRETPKVVLNSKSIAEQIQTFCNEMSKVYSRNVFNRLTNLHPLEREGPNAMTNIMHTHNITTEDVLFLELSGIPEFDCAAAHEDAVKLKDSTLDVFPEEKLVMMMRSIVGLHYEAGNADIKAQVRRAKLGYKDVFIILHGIDLGYFAVVGQPRSTYRKIDETTCEDDIPMLRNAQVGADVEYQSIPAVIVGQTSRRKGVMVSPMAYTLFDRNIILDAWKESVIMKSTKPATYVTGWPCEENSAYLQTTTITQEYIDHIVERFRDDENAMPRENGIAFIRRTHKNPIIERFLTEPGREATKHNPAFEIYAKDMESESATRQHVACGFGIDEPVHTPDFIYQRYIAAGGKLGRDKYPEDLLEAYEEEMKETEQNYATGTLTVGRRAILEANAVESRQKKRKINN